MRPMVEIVGGSKAITKLLFVTTNWDRIESQKGIAREKDICLSWQPLLSAGAGIARFDKKTETAWRILDPLLQQKI